MNSSYVYYESLLAISEAIRRKETSPTEVTQAVLERIEQTDSSYHSFVSVCSVRALARARAAEDEINRGMWRGPLHGVPIGLKDLCYTDFAPTTCGTAIMASFTPNQNATVVDRLETAGAITVGKQKMVEAAYTNYHPSVQPTINPWDPARWVGTSSTGSGVATALGCGFGAIGSDTGGSIRFPSATCGVTGLKPTWGRVSRYGVFPFAASMDHVGPLARTAADTGALFNIIAGSDPADPTTLNAAVPNYLERAYDGVRGVTVGIDWEFVTTDVDDDVVAALHAIEGVLRTLGARVRHIRLPSSIDLVRKWDDLCAVEAVRAHDHYYPTRADEYGPEFRNLLDRGRQVSGPEIMHIMYQRAAYSGSLKRIFGEVDVLLLPVLGFVTPKVVDMERLGRDVDSVARTLRFTAPFNFSGNPTITLPAGVDRNGMPIGIQLVGDHLTEALLIQAGVAFQSVTGWHTLRPVYGQ